jgi:glycosyltransferase involved in cell wall biosynthesis
MKKISTVIAVYENSESLQELYKSLIIIFENILSEYDYELIFVDDGSKDHSLEILIKLAKVNSRVKVISFTRNFGQIPAIMAGFRLASGDAVINISADLQDPVDLIPQMIDAWRTGSKNVVCYRVDRDDPLLARIFSRIAYGFLKASIPQIPAGGFDFVLLDRDALEVFNAFDTRHRFFQGDVLWGGFITTFIPYVRLKRVHGKSQWKIKKKIKYFLDAVLDATYFPIRIMTVIGFMTSALGLLYSGIIFLYWVNGDTPFSGWAPIMITILIIGGVLMMMLGVIGEYLWRIYEEIRKRPNYLIKDIYGK